MFFYNYCLKKKGYYIHQWSIIVKWSLHNDFGLVSLLLRSKTLWWIQNKMPNRTLHPQEI